MIRIQVHGALHPYKSVGCTARLACAVVLLRYCESYFEWFANIWIISYVTQCNCIVAYKFEYLRCIHLDRVQNPKTFCSWEWRKWIWRYSVSFLNPLWHTIQRPMKKFKISDVCTLESSTKSVNFLFIWFIMNLERAASFFAKSAV